MKYLTALGGRALVESFATHKWNTTLDIELGVKVLLNEVLHLRGRAFSFDEHTVLLGAVPELDSMAVIAVITAIEERFQCCIDDDEIDSAVFSTVGSLTRFVAEKTGLLSE